MRRLVSLEDLYELFVEVCVDEEIDYLSIETFNYVAQDFDGELCLFEYKPKSDGAVWDGPDEGELFSLGYFDVEEWPEGTLTDRCISPLPIITSLDNV